MTSIDPIASASRSEAAATLAAAFATDPVFRWMARDREDLDVRLRHGFSAMLAGELRRAEPLVQMTSDGGSAAIWHAPDQWQASVLETVRVAPGFVRSFGVRIGRLLSMMNKLDDEHPAEPHYHLAFIGTDPARQGIGLGSQLLAPMIDRCDREGVPAYLENSNPSNEAFYVRHGFVVTGPMSLPPGAPPITAMWRTPR